MNDPVHDFFYPSSLCLAGASSKEKSIGYELLKTIISYGYKGRIFPVNPKAEEVLGVKCFSSVTELPEAPALAVVAVPKQSCLETIEELLKKGTRSIVLITAGFKETGREGQEMEDRIVRMVKSYGARMTGPNCMGVINTHEGVRLNATFAAECPAPGHTGFLSQSGALGAAILNSIRETDIRLAHFLSVGNKADITENDILKYWQTDESVKVMTMYLESFSDGRDLIRQLSDGSLNKPVVILKAGRGEGGMRAASSHTGALGSSDRSVEAVMKQFGVIRADDLNELFNTAKAFESFPIPLGNRIAVITNAGGPAILCVDALERRGLKLASLSAETRARLASIVHPEGSLNNPVDLLPGGTAETYRDAAALLLEDAGVDAVVSIFVEPVMVRPFGVIEALNSISSHKPLMQICMPVPDFWEKYRNESAYKKPVFRNPEDPAEVLSNMLFFKEHQLRSRNAERLSARKGVAPVALKTSGYLDQQQINELSDEYAIPLAEAVMISPDDAENLRDFSRPLVVKAISRDVIHKSEMNAVALNIASAGELKNETMRMKRMFEDRGVLLESFLIQPYIKAKHELLLGGFRDTAFGPMIMFGSGGKYVEVVNDTSIRSAMMNEHDLDDIIFSTRIGKILKGVRGERPTDVNKLKQLIRNCALMMLENELIEEFDLNPLMIDENDELHAVDVRIRCR